MIGLISRMVEARHTAQEQRLQEALRLGRELLAHFKAKGQVRRMQMGLDHEQEMVFSLDSQGTIQDYGVGPTHGRGHPSDAEVAWVGQDLTRDPKYTGVDDVLYRNRKKSPEAAALHRELNPYLLDQWLGIR